MKTAIVTGGGRGIGLAITNALAREGANVAVMGQSPYERVEDKLKPLGERCVYVRGSVACAEDRQALLTAAIAKFGGVDLLVNNAGIAPRVRADILDMTEDSFDEVLSVNLKGAMFLTQLVAKHMLARERAGDARGVIINISSISSRVSSTNRAEYCVSKAGLSMLTKLYADRLAREGIYVYEIQPGIIETDMTSAVKQKYDALISTSAFPIHRWGTPDDVAEAVLLLASGRLMYTTGQVIHVDGGYMDVRNL